MIIAALFLILALAWTVGVGATVLESAGTEATAIVAFDRVLYVPDTAEIGIWILCVLSASAALAVVTALFVIRGHRLERQMAAELDSRMATRSQRDVGDAAVTMLLEHREVELQTSVDQLTAKRDALYEEIRQAKGERDAIPVIHLKDADEISDPVDAVTAPASSETSG